MEALRNRASKPLNYRRADQVNESSTFTLANIIRSARMIVVAPLATAAYQIPVLLSAANYSGALKCASVSSVCFLLLAISTTLADFLIHLPELICGRQGR
jgi:hypothetical protein